MKKALCAMLLVFCMLLGCSCNLGAYRYHISVVKEGYTVREEWETANSTYGAYRRVDLPDGDWDVIMDETSPKTRTHLIVSKEELNEGFSVFPAVNFESQMLVVHFYTDAYNRQRKIDYAKLDGGDIGYSFLYRFQSRQRGRVYAVDAHADFDYG